MYPFECPECGWKIETFRKIAMRDASTGCRCGAEMVRTIARPNINPDYEPYQDPNLVPMHKTGAVWIKSRKHRNEVMRERGLVAVG